MSRDRRTSPTCRSDARTRPFSVLTSTLGPRELLSAGPKSGKNGGKNGPKSGGKNGNEGGKNGGKNGNEGGKSGGKNGNDAGKNGGKNGGKKGAKVVIDPDAGEAVLVPLAFVAVTVYV